MTKSLNKSMIIGTLGRDPELRFMPNGNAVANISVATDESYVDKSNGAKVESTEWHRLIVYGKLAETCHQYLKKGSRAYFEGKLRTREWEKDGVKRYTTEIVISDVTFLDSRNDGHSSQNTNTPNPGTCTNHNQNTASGYSAPSASHQQPNQPRHPQPSSQSSQPQYPANGFDSYNPDDVPF